MTLPYTHQMVRVCPELRVRVLLNLAHGTDAYFADLVQGYREELRALYAAGCRNIQFDDPTFAFFCADSTIEGMEKAGVDWQQLLDMYIQVYNDILQGRPADFTIGLHTCRGNYQVRAPNAFFTPRTCL